jgi:cell fate regulator YaaT (PSP1 superfamily)
MIEKQRDEYEAMMICREKVAQRGLPMQIVDAEYQWCVSRPSSCTLVATADLAGTAES